MIGYPFFRNNESYAQYSLIDALLKAIALAIEIWKISQPTEGRITLVNMHDAYREGDVQLLVVGPRGVESFGLFRIECYHDIKHLQVRHGPYGTSPGRKGFCRKTATGLMATNMYVEV